MLQINAEVKRLLVASVGEDIEAKVDYLTQDKARLAADIRQYASKISRDFEEKEKLAVESTLWKSKFLACRCVARNRMIEYYTKSLLRLKLISDNGSLCGYSLNNLNTLLRVFLVL